MFPINSTWPMYEISFDREASEKDYGIIALTSVSFQMGAWIIDIVDRNRFAVVPISAFGTQRKPVVGFSELIPRIY